MLGRDARADAERRGSSQPAPPWQNASAIISRRAPVAASGGGGIAVKLVMRPREAVHALCWQPARANARLCAGARGVAEPRRSWRIGGSERALPSPASTPVVVAGIGALERGPAQHERASPRRRGRASRASAARARTRRRRGTRTTASPRAGGRRARTASRPRRRAAARPVRAARGRARARGAPSSKSLEAPRRPVSAPPPPPRRAVSRTVSRAQRGAATPEELTLSRRRRPTRRRAAGRGGPTCRRRERPVGAGSRSSNSTGRGRRHPSRSGPSR